MFEQASRLQLRWDYKGQVGTEDLWQLPLTALDAIYKALNKQMKLAEEESLLAESSAADKLLALKIEIVKHVVKVRQEENAAKKAAADKKAEKERLLELIAKKQDQSLEALSIEELMKRVQAL